MFKYQVSLFGIAYQLPLGVNKMLDERWDPAFRRLVFDKIDERRCAVLCSNNVNRPNFPVNVWVGLEILKGQFDYTDEELMWQFHFDLLTAYALRQEKQYLGTSDEVIAAERVPEIKERMDIKEMITDAGFTGEVSEKVCDTEGVALIPTEVKGRKLSEDELSLKDFEFAEGKIVACPAGQPPAREIHNEEKERWVVRFSREWCGSCPMIGQCPVAERQKFYSLSFTDRQAVVARRRQALDQEDYREKRRLRPAVEGTVSQFKRRTHNGKLTVRGYRRVRNAIIAMAIGINFGRIWAYLEQKKRDMTHSLIPISALFVALAVISTGEWLRKRLMAQTMAQEAIC